jgi:cytochrome c peroxidase
MHDGRFTTLEEIIDHYNDDVKPSPTVELCCFIVWNGGLQLNSQKADLVAFLKTLTDEAFLADERFSKSVLKSTGRITRITQPELPLSSDK